MKQQVLLLLVFLLLASVSHAYTIEGNSVFIEDAQASLRVTPHTASSPVNKFRQEFEVCNKTGIETTLYAGYVFDKALQAGKVEYWQTPAYGWVEHEVVCEYDFNYVTNEDTDQNPHRAWCYDTIDQNGTNVNVVYWEQEFKTGDPATKTIQYDVNELVSGNSWFDVTNLFLEYDQEINGRYIYPFTTGLAFPATTCKTWRIEYTPDPNTINKKWDLWLWANATGWDCILTDTCQKTLKLDPWWDSEWSSKFAINSMIISEDLNANNWINLESIDFSALNSACADASDITVVNETTSTEVSDLNFQGWNGTSTDTDVNILFKVTEALPANTYNGEYYIYSNNIACSASTARTFEQGSYDGFENGNYTTSPKWYDVEHTGETITVEAGAKKVGTYGLKIVIEGAGYSTLSNYNFGSGVNPPYKQCFWTYVTDVSKRNYVVLYNGVNQIAIFGIEANDFYAAIQANVYETEWTNNPSALTWYHFCMSNDGLGSVTFDIYDTDDALIESTVLAATIDLPIKEERITIQGAGTYYVDNITFEVPRKTTFVLGGEESENTNLSITTINGLDYTTKPVFAYGLNGNITIDFNVLQKNNKRLTIDLNYSQSITQGTGTIIIEDLNLNASICPNQNWNILPSECSYSWNYSTVADGNYGIIGFLTDSDGAIDFNNSDGNFEILNSVDLNITTINGEDYKIHPVFAYGLDKNITIDFNVYDTSNRRLTIDLNYSQSITQGTGTVIVKDLNLTAAYCPNQDFRTVSKCSYSWDYSTVADGNYGIIGLVTNSNSLTDFNTSDANFQIANDVNLTIYTPIDETTGEAIDTSTYSFIVKVLNAALTTYSNNTDTNYFSIPISEAIIILIDTNVDAYYWGREYSFFYQTAQSSDTLQPYLAPLGSSVLTTIHTVSMATLTAIPGMRIKIFKDLPGGRTLINDSVTDGKGETAVAFVIADNYEIEVWTNSVLLYTENYVATATTSNHYIYLPIGGGVSYPTIPNISVRYLPALRERTSKDFNIQVIIASNNGSISSARINLFNNGINIYDTGLDTLISSDGNTYTINVNDLAGFDTAYPLDANVTVWLIDGTTITSREDSWRVMFADAPEDSMMWLLTNGMRKDFGCSYGTDQLLGTTCQPLFLISIFIIFFAIGGLALNQFRNGTALAILAIIMTSFFVYITWIPFVWGVLMAVAGIVIIITTSRVDM